MKQETEIDLRKLTRELAAMETIRTRYMPVWQEISEYILPGRGIFDKSEPNQGDRRDKKIIDPTAPQALHVLSAGLQGGLTGHGSGSQSATANSQIMRRLDYGLMMSNAVCSM